MLKWSTERAEFVAFSIATRSESSSLINAYGGFGSELFLERAKPNGREPYDALLFEFCGQSPSGWVEYVDPSELRDCAKNKTVLLSGKAFLRVHFDSTRRDPGFITNDLSGRRTIRDAKQICDADGGLEWAIEVSDLREFAVDVSNLRGDEGCVVVAVCVKR